MPRQVRLFQAIDLAFRTARPDVFDLMKTGAIAVGWGARAMHAWFAGSLPSRILDWFDAELQHPGVLSMQGWPALFGDARNFVAAIEVTDLDVGMLFDPKDPLPSLTGIAEIAAICTIVAIDGCSSKKLGAKLKEEKAERKRDRQAINRLKKRLPKYIRVAEEDGDAHHIQEYKNLVDSLNNWPGFPLRRYRDFDWHVYAAEIADAYEDAFGSLCGWSKDGPGIKFIAKAIERTLGIRKSHDALEKAIDRARRLKLPQRAADIEALDQKLASQSERHRRRDRHRIRKWLQDPENLRRAEEQEEEEAAFRRILDLPPRPSRIAKFRGSPRISGDNAD